LCQVAADAGEALRLRQEAALALAKVNGANAVPCLTGALRGASKGDGDEQLRISLVQALGATGSPAALSFLKTYAAGPLSRDEQAFVAKYVPPN
jgi:HEAT repeat protein